MIETCPHCGAALPDRPMFSKMKQQIFDYIREHPGCRKSDIMLHVYGHLKAPPHKNVISVHIWKMRSKLKDAGYRIKCSYPGARYTLTKDPQNGPL